MTISSSLASGVAGLFANATRLATIADNIANSGTFGYKRVTAEFDSFVIGGSRGAGTYSAGGVRASTTRLIDEHGALVSTANATDIAISGRGMLPVTTSVALQNNNGDLPMLMTTTGSFHTDENGVNPRDTAAGLVPVVINANQSAGDPTTEMSLVVNLPATSTEYSATAFPAEVLEAEYFGNLGTSETLGITFTPTAPALATDPPTNTWTMVITDSAQNDAVIGEYTLVFNDSRTDGGTLDSVTVVSGGAYNATDGTLALTVAGGPMTVTIGKLGDNNGLTQLSDSFVPTVNKDGSPVGNLTAVEVDENGYVTATYDTGFTRRIYQIPIVDVPSPNGLITLSNQVYQVSPDSGSFYLWDAGDGPTGSMQGYAREGSTTDVAGELTNLIQTQRAYSSNAKVIQTVDEMLQETTNIKR
jgi:flagellar hook protein FlgE